jgi:23S rRNA (adenine2030-N6)-methyltransferase
VAPGKLSACGLLVINPPWKFEEAMREALPWVAAQLGQGVSASLSTGAGTARAEA